MISELTGSIPVLGTGPPDRPSLAQFVEPPPDRVTKYIPNLLGGQLNTRPTQKDLHDSSVLSGPFL